MSVHIIVVVIWSSFALTTLYAWLKGGFAERAGATLNLICALAAAAADALVGESNTAIPLLLIDLALAFGFLVIAMRFASIWLGAAMLLQAVQFCLHAFYMVVERPRDLLFDEINNIDTIGILIALLVATSLTWRKTAKARPAPVEAPPAVPAAG
jgi:hypothetical protein